MPGRGSRHLTRNVNREERAAYSELVGSDPVLLQAQMDAMVYWSDQVGWEAGGNHYFSTNQVQWPGDGYYYDLIFDAALPGESTCWQDSQHCRTMFEGYTAYSSHFPDLNFQVVVWNAYYYAINPHPSPVDGVPFWEFIVPARAWPRTISLAMIQTIVVGSWIGAVTRPMFTRRN